MANKKKNPKDRYKPGLAITFTLPVRKTASVHPEREKEFKKIMEKEKKTPAKYIREKMNAQGGGNNVSEMIEKDKHLRKRLYNYFNTEVLMGGYEIEDYSEFVRNAIDNKLEEYGKKTHKDLE